MPGSNGNSSYEKLFGEYDGTINTDKEFKSFEKTISSDGGKEDLVKVCEEDSKNVVAAFDQTKLEEKVKLARTPDKKNAKNKMKPEVKDAYLVIGKLKEGKVGSFNKLLETAEGEVTLEKAKQDILDKINSNSDWDAGMKETARNVIEDLFAECDSVEEFESRAGTRIGTVESMDNIGDFFKAIPKEIYEKHQALSKATLQFFEQIGMAFDDVKILCQKGIEQGILKRNDFVDRCKEKGMTVVDITKTVCEWGGSQFASFVSYLRERGEDVTQALMTAWEFVGGEWNKFVEFCGGQVDMIKDFGMVLIEAGKITGKQLIQGLIANTEVAKQLCEELVEKGLIKMGELVDICNEWGEKGKDMLISVLEKSVNLWNSFADYCLENWESMKDMFAKVTMELLNRGKFVLETFVQWCKKSWEVVGEVACGILVGLVKIGKYTVEAITDVLTVTVGLPVMLVSELLIAAGKEIYKDSIAVAKFVSDLSAVLWEKARQLGMSASEFVKDFINKCKEFGLMSKAYIENIVKGVWEKMKEFGMTASDFIKVTYEIVKLSLGNARNKTAEFFKNLGLKIEDIAVTLWEASKGAWKECVDFVVKSYKDFKTAMDLLINRCKIGLDKIGEAIMQTGVKVVEFINYVKELGKITFDNISKWCGGKWEKITMFVRVAIEAAGVTWQNLVDWCGGQIDKIAVALREIYGKGKQKIMDFIKFTGKTALEAGKLLLKLGIGTVGLVILALKELGQSLVDVTKLCVDNLVKYGKIAVNALCEALLQAYGNTKEKVVAIGKAVAGAVRTASKAVRDWVYAKTKDAKRAVEATKEFITTGVKDIAEWMYEKRIQIHDICKVIGEEFKGNVKEIVAGLKDFARDRALNWNEVVAEASAFLTIDV